MLKAVTSNSALVHGISLLGSSTRRLGKECRTHGSRIWLVSNTWVPLLRSPKTWADSQPCFITSLTLDLLATTTLSVTYNRVLWAYLIATRHPLTPLLELLVITKPHVLYNKVTGLPCTQSCLYQKHTPLDQTFNSYLIESIFLN